MLNKKLIFICSIFFSILIVLVNVKILVSDEKFFHKEFEKYGVYSALKGYDVDEINKQVFGFFNYKNSLPLDFFNEREVKHLNDVKEVLYGVDFLLFLVLIFICSYK